MMISKYFQETIKERRGIKKIYRERDPIWKTLCCCVRACREEGALFIFVLTAGKKRFNCFWPPSTPLDVLIEGGNAQSGMKLFFLSGSCVRYKRREKKTNSVVELRSVVVGNIKMKRKERL